MTRVDVHPASLSDIPQLCRLYFDFHEFHAAGLPERLVSLGSWEAYDASQLACRLEEILNHDNSCLLVAKNNGGVLGFVEIYLRQEEPDPARAAFVYAHLQSLMVAPGWRKQGIGKRLVQAAETWAAGKGAAEVRLDTWEFPGDPVKFYEGVGYRTLKRKLVRRL
jgi:aminoglycoside 6'-N-acetyltransferase I